MITVGVNWFVEQDCVDPALVRDGYCWKEMVGKVELVVAWQNEPPHQYGSVEMVAGSIKLVVRANNSGVIERI